ncbi:amino acid adenylation domain-containing protein [Duganella sp. FT50W]|uniref:Amino acid adenylation domain-containing protein n=1 Tax=Duganella lactea TaxID=2692173 RepID=A0A6L8MS51_9BURK|nr:non-ribosomal peptide synthetase [Duganella lactea]MYM84903.1 amino acid adenylation domain-containing protein [Duganella lactea]
MHNVNGLSDQQDQHAALQEELLSLLMSETADSAYTGSAAPIGRAERTEALPLSWAQQRLWFLDQFDPAGALAYHMPAAFRLRGRLNLPALQAALDRVVMRHESLRTCFALHKGEPVQVIGAADYGFALEVNDLSQVPAAEQASAIKHCSRESARRPFDLARGPLIRGELLMLSDQEWVLLINQHHIISDGWSTGILAREIGAIYTAMAQGLPDPLPLPPLQYADYAVWQRHSLQGPVMEGHIQYWKQQLAGLPPLLTLPTDRPRPAIQTSNGAARAFTINETATAGLQALARGNQATLFMVLYAALNVLLARHAGQTDLCIGTPVANRSRVELEGVMGFFVNVLPLRARIDWDSTFVQLIEQARHTALAAYEHQDLPIDQLVDALKPQRETSYPPLFQVLLLLQNMPATEITAADLRFESLNVDSIGAKLDLTMYATEQGGRLKCLFEYNTDLFDAATIARMVEHFVRLIDEVVANPSRPLCRLPLMGEEEREQLLFAFNQTQQAYPVEKMLHQLFEEQVVRQPDAVALVAGDVVLSYGELNARANQVAHRLLALGVQADARVAICAERSVEMVVGLLGILKAGGAYVPLDPAYPAERLAYMLEDSAPVALLQHGWQAPAGLAMPVLALGDAAIWSGYGEDNPALPGQSASQLAYVIYTSGSTGQPKGVMNQHDGVVNRLLWAQDEYRLTAADRVLQKTPFSFDVSVWEFFLPLCAGAQLHMAAPGIHKEPARLSSAIQQAGITIIHFVPSMLQSFLEHEAAAACVTLRDVFCSGEALSVALQQRCMSLLPQAGLHNLYGPTEAAIDVSYWRCQQDTSGSLVPIGAPVANTQLYILDAHQQPVPVGVTGELYIGGIQVARGYLNRPELTAQRFIADPFGAAGGRLYRTGDLARWRPEGVIEYLGRNDFQVKVRGFRIELGEIEARLAACDGVREAVVIAREDVAGDKRLVAYLLAQPGAVLAAAALREQLSQHLAEYMVPSAFVVLEAYPLTPNGKLDRKALPAPDQAAVATRAYAAPQGEIETAVARIWQELLGLEQVGRHDHFFELGGHSLLAVQMMSRLRQMLRVEVPLRQLFSQPVLAAFSQALASAAVAADTVIVPADRTAPLPLSWAQQRLWFLDQLDHAAGAAYHIPAALRLRGRLDKAALQATLDRIVARHESLRTCFVAQDGEPVQVIAPADCGFVLTGHDLSDLRGHEQEAAVARWSQDEAVRPFDLAQGPLIRGQLLTLSEQEWVLLVTQHHIISDGWSIGNLVREVRALYTAYVQGEADPLAPLAIQYADYAAWQRGWLQGEVLERQLGYWKQHLGGAPALLELPTDRPRPAQQSYAGDRVHFTLPAALTSGLRELSRAHGATLFMTLQAAWAVLLSRLSGQDDIVVGTPVANRQRAEVEGLIGFFVNTLALRVKLDDDPDVNALLARVKADMLEAYAHQDLPFEQVVEALQPVRSMSHNALVQVMLTYETEVIGGALDLPDMVLSPIAKAQNTAQFDLEMYITDAGHALDGSVVYATDLFDKDTIVRMVSQLQNVLAAMVADPMQQVSRLPLMGEQERQQLLLAFNATQRAYPSQRLIHQLFEEQAARQPDAVALVAGDVVLSYGELNARANQVAHRLLALGVQADARVAICAERSVEMVVGLLGILKAGGAYVPLDPAYPAERLAYMLEDSAPVALLQHGWQAPAGLAMPVLALGDAAIWSGFGEDNPVLPGQSAAQLAYVIYTSGSTGQPKGVMVEHRNVLRLVINNPYVEIATDDRVVHCANPSFDAATWEIWASLLNGARLLIIDQPTLLDVAAFEKVLEQQGANVLHLTVGLFNQYVDALAKVFPRLKYLMFGGDQSDIRNVARVLHNSAPQKLVHCYGPTETTTFASTYLVEQVQKGASQLPIGRPIGNTQVYILDRHLQPVPIGVVGEMYIGGAGVARGYLNRAELTAERFIADPFGAAGGRLYRTGDLGRWLPDGVIEYLGRNDFQVKIRGFRVELGEIEARLAACDGVREAVVIAREDEPGDKRLVAYLLTDNGAGAVGKSATGIELWPSIGEYFVYDELIYYGLTNDTLRNQKYRKALSKIIQDRVVVDIGTGRDAVLSRMCVELGARHVYAIEIFEATYLAASKLVKELGLEHRITVIHGDAKSVTLPEPADICVSEIVEAIGGAEGAAPIINGAWSLMKPQGVMVPQRSRTMIAAVSLPAEIAERPAFTPVSEHYVKKIFEQVGNSFDVRLCVKNFPRDHIVSSTSVYEDLNFAGVVEEEFNHELSLTVEKDGRFDGFLLWMVLHLDQDEVIDILDHTYAWFPTYLPVFDPGVAVQAGDQLQLRCWSRISDNGVNPDYFVKGTLVRDGLVLQQFEHASLHHTKETRHGPFYRRLFGEENKTVVDQSGQWRAQLSASLPEYMLPTAFVTLDSFPLTPNGKLDRKALPIPQRSVQPTADYEAPLGEAEQAIAALWQEMLKDDRLPGRREDFFTLGGNSLLAVQLVGRLKRQFSVEVTIRDLFEHSRLADLSDLIISRQLALYTNDAGHDLDTALDGLSEAQLLEILAKGSVSE